MTSFLSYRGNKNLDGRTDGRTDGRKDGRTDGRTEGISIVPLSGGGGGLIKIHH